MRIQSMLHALAACTLAAAEANAANVEHLYKFPNYTWLENLAAKEDGSVLVTLLQNGTVAQLSPPHFDAPKTVSKPMGVPGVMGITEISKDVFAYLAGNVNLSSPIATNWSLWTVNFCGKKPRTQKLVDLPQLGFANGLTSIPGYAFIADQAAGKIFRLDLQTKTVEVLLQDPLLNGTAPTDPGVNGVRASSDFKQLYFTNSAKQFLGKFSIDHRGHATGPIQNVTGLGKCDDFAVASDGTAYVAGSRDDDILKVTPPGQSSILVGRSPDIFMPSSIVLGRGAQKGTLFVTDGGTGAYNAAAASPVSGGQLLRIKV